MPAPTDPTTIYSDAITGTSGLVSHYRFDETTGTTAYDAYGSNDGTYSGGYTLGVSSAPGLNTAVAFSAAAMTAPAPFTSTSDFTIEAWFNSTDITITNQPVWLNGSSGDGYGIYVSGNNTNSGHIFILYQGVYWYDTGAIVTSGVWNYVTFSISSTGGTNVVYLNGTQIYSNNLGGPLTPSGGNFYVGYDPAGRYFSGSLDEIGSYSTVLSGSTIVSHYNAAGDGTQSARVAQVGALSIITASPNSRIAQIGSLAVTYGSPNVRIPQVGLLAITPNAPATSGNNGSMLLNIM